MKHLNEEELVAYCGGDADGREAAAAHLHNCAACREELERIESVLALLKSLPEPDAGPAFEQRMWRQIAPRLPKRREWTWREWFAPRRLVAAGALAAVIFAAFLTGRLGRPKPTEVPALSAEQVRERVLLVAVGNHLDRSEIILVELSNAQPPAEKGALMNISAEQKRAADLIEENRLYRQTAQQQGDAVLASVLDELERALLDFAHSPDQVTPAQFEALRQRVEAHGLLFKVRIVGQDVREKEQELSPGSKQDSGGKKGRNKA
ncbi:MAG TPA: hypothetical protein VEH49_05920 [Methylomirabilota bacterium]|nr:hypothetical protein [Methylomirabilota bacterium]